jgi:polyisoprenoid-binding protein YceI
MKRSFSMAAALLVAASLGARAQQPPPTGQTPPPSPPAQGQQQRPPQTPLGPNQWRIDGSHSAAHFSVRHNVVSTVRGQLGPISGLIEYDGKSVQSIKADVTIDVTKINTQNQGRDDHLRRDDFFNAEQYPNMTFKSKRVEPAGEGKFKLVGDLTIRDKTNEVVLDVEGPAPVVNGRRGVITGATATTKISRKTFGVLWNNLIEAMPVVGDEVTVTIDLELTRPALPGTTAGGD